MGGGGAQRVERLDKRDEERYEKEAYREERGWIEGKQVGGERGGLGRDRNGEGGRWDG